MAVKRYYWIKLKDTFLTSDAVDFLMSQKNGANYVVLYQMLCLKTVNTGGELSRQIGEVIIPFDVDKIQRDCKYFEKDTIIVALELYKKLGLVYENKNGFLQIANFDNLVGSETAWAEYKRKAKNISRGEIKILSHEQIMLPDGQVKFVDNKRYGGNGFLAYQRANGKCEECGSTENLCIHHNNGYSNDIDDLYILCGKCHAKVERKKQPLEIFQSRSKISPTEVQQDIDIRDKILDIRDKILDTRYNSTDIDSNNNSNSNNTNAQHEQQDCSLPKENIFITLSLNDNSEFEVTESFLNELKPLYPMVDVEQEFRNMKGWLLGNPKKRKTRTGIKRFITNWLSNKQNNPQFNNNYINSNNKQNDFEQRKNQFADIIRKNRERVE